MQKSEFSKFVTYYSFVLHARNNVLLDWTGREISQSFQAENASAPSVPEGTPQPVIWGRSAGSTEDNPSLYSEGGCDLEDNLDLSFEVIVNWLHSLSGTFKRDLMI